MENIEDQVPVETEIVQPVNETQSIEAVQPVEETQQVEAEPIETGKSRRETVHCGEPEIVTHVGAETIHKLVDRFEQEEVSDYPHAVHIDSEGRVLSPEQLEQRRLNHKQKAA